MNLVKNVSLTLQRGKFATVGLLETILDMPFKGGEGGKIANTHRRAYVKGSGERRYLGEMRHLRVNVEKICGFVKGRTW